MSDNYGSTQPRVLEVSERSWDNIVFGQAMPPGSSDIMLPGLVANEKSAVSVRASTPSGWVQMGDIVAVSDPTAAEASSSAGTVLVSGAYPSNTFGLVAPGTLQAVVNGWVINVKGTNTSGNHNRITLPSMVNVPSSRVDSVFLEVWRELITKDSTIYPNGNDDAGTTLPNDLVNPLAGVETTQRVQLKYRIRVTTSDMDLAGSPDGINASVYGQGAMTSPSLLGFTKQSTDAGLYRAGNGDQSSREALGTVDGYVYAIPMFGIFRRAQSAGFSSDAESSTLFVKGDAKHSDRPDGFYLDVIYADDIVDLRHQILAPLEGVLAKTFRQAVSGSLRTRRGLARSSSGFVEVPGGSRLTKGEELGTGATALPLIDGSSTSTLIKRAIYCNASVDSPYSVVEYYPGTAWVAGSYSGIDLVGTTPMKAIAALGVYGDSPVRVAVIGVDVNVTISGDGFTMEVTVLPGSWLIGTSTHIKIQMLVSSVAGINGTYDVPEKYLCVRNNVASVSYPVGMEALYIAGQSLTNKDFLVNESIVPTSSWRQGVTLGLHMVLATADSVSLTLTGGKKYGYEALGIKSVQREVSPGVYGAHQDFTVIRNVLGSDIEYIIDNISTIDGETSTNVRVTLAVKAKTLDLSRQGRGVIGIYETMLVTPVYESGSFFVDTGDKPIVALGTSSKSLLGLKSGQMYAYVGTPTSTVRRNLAVGVDLPVIGSASYANNLYAPTKVKVTISGTVNPTDTILVPVVVASYLEASDSFSIFYKTAGYQGTSSVSNVLGTVMSEGAAVAASQGSGKVVDKQFYPISDNKALFTTGSQTVTRVQGAIFTGNVLVGDLFFKESDGELLAYVVQSVDSANQVTLEEPYQGTTSSGAGDHFGAIRPDCPEGSVFCVIDRMPSRVEDSYMGDSYPLSSYGDGVLTLAKKIAIQDPMDARKGDVLLGVGPSGIRGNVGMQLTSKGNDLFNQTYKVPAIVYEDTGAMVPYKKAYQSYMFKEESTGKLLMAVVVSESGQATPNNALIADTLVDVVDTFELVGRPLISN